MKLLLRKKRKNKKIYLIVFFIIISIIFSILFINFYSKRAAPVITNYAEGEIKRLLYLVINNSTYEYTSKVDVNDIFIVRYNSAGEIILIDFDAKKSSELLMSITNLVEYNLKNIEEGNVEILRNYYSDYNYDLLKKGIVVEVPFGTSFNSNFLNNLGPKIPVRISFTKNIECGFNTEVLEYGINNALLKLNININVNVNVILPFISNNIDTNFTIPIAMKVIQGKIPSYYMNGFSTNSNGVKNG